MAQKFNLLKPVIVADAGLLSDDNLTGLEQKQYEYIIGARLKSEATGIKQQILSAGLKEK